MFQSALQLITVCKLHASCNFLLFSSNYMEIFKYFFIVGTLGFPGILIYCFQVTSKVMERQYLHTSCLQAYPIFSLNPLLEKLIFNVWEYFQEPGTLALSCRSLPGKNIPNLEKNTAQSVHKLNNFGEMFFFLVFRWSFHFTKYTRNFLVGKLKVLVDG